MKTRTTNGAKMKRTSIVAALAAAVSLVLPGLAAAQAVYPPGPSRPVKIIVTTPGATITITGSNWGPGTTVTFIKRPPPARTQAAGTTSGTGTIGATAPGDGGSVPATTASSDTASDQAVLGTTTVEPDGTYEATLTVPEDAVGNVDVVATGTDGRGHDRTETTVLAVDEAVAVTPAPRGPAVWQLLLVGLVTVTVGGGGVAVRRRRHAS
ncbi:MAG: hypothetical protein M3N57_03565 [Actinomycetota bacterium]|nr:hypothetical protein [Actinomycetota bacterium]